MAKIVKYFLISESNFLNLLSIGLKNLDLIDYQYLTKFYEIYQDEKSKNFNFYLIAVIKVNNEELEEFFYCEFFIDLEGDLINLGMLEENIEKILEENKKFKNISILKYIYDYTDEYSPYELQTMFFDFILQNITAKSTILH